MSSHAERELDPDQRAAVAVEVNAVVSAGAGSGKTTVLAERYLRLIRTGRATVDSILTLTFTRKAAAEMHDRIYRRLLSMQEDPLVSAALPRFDRAQISTLDSFCGQIARADCTRFGIPPDFSTDEERVAELVEETAMEFLLVHRHNDALVELIEQSSFEGVWRECLLPLGLNYFSVSERTDFAALGQGQERALIDNVERVYQAVSSLRAEALTFDPAAGAKVRALAAWFENLSDWPDLVRAGDFDTVSRQAAELWAISLPGHVVRPDLVAAKETLKMLRPHCAAAAEIVGTLKLAPATRELFALVSEFEGILLNRKQQQALLSFEDVMRLAVSILRDNLDLRRYYQRKFSQILIDEFQDNNGLQRDLLFLLAQKPDRAAAGWVPESDELEPGKLFFVGDEKQSIYLFRGADVSVFKQLSTQIAANGGRSLSLPTNYRSHPTLIGFFNSLFSSIMASSELPYEAEFEPLRSPSDPSVSSQAGAAQTIPETASIRFLYKPLETGVVDQSGANTLHRDDAEAVALAAFIDRSVRGRKPLLLPGDGHVRPATFDDFAILLRSGSNQIRYERMLRLHDIPYTSQTIRSLFLEAPQNDLYAVLQLVIHPYDRVAYAAVLRSPFVHVSDNALVRILASKNPPFEHCDLSEPDLSRYESGRRLFQRLGELADHVPTAELLRVLWYDFGYRYTLLRDPAYHTYLEYFDYFTALAERNTGDTLAEFLDIVRPHLGKYEKLPELSVLREQVRGVQIMTIHAAKGLEFPIVILANMGNTGRAEGSGTRPYYVHPEYGLTFNQMPTDRAPGSRKRVNYFFNLGKDERQARERAELKRVLYVGMTRAQSHLVVSGVHHARNADSDDALLNIFMRATGENTDLALLTETIPDISSDQFLRMHRPAKRPDLKAAVELYRSSEIVDRSFPRTTFTVTELNQERTSAPAVSESPLPAIASDSLLVEYELESQFGTLCHLILQRRISGLLSAASEIAARELREAGLAVIVEKLSPEQITTLIGDAWSLSENFMRSSVAELMGKGSEVQTEVPFVLRRVESGVEQFIHGQIDLMVRVPQEILVVDFKTDRAIRPGEYDLQLDFYRAAAPDLLSDHSFRGLPVRSLLFYLRGGQSWEAEGEPRR
ncbi:MAG TPA: UvrD-helicase domain-containing protein [Spirochaetia bacterium]|nr:UvrD-helicase domain-containing protein [Spirochaetia bacterium]